MNWQLMFELTCWLAAGFAVGGFMAWLINREVHPALVIGVFVALVIFAVGALA